MGEEGTRADSHSAAILEGLEDFLHNRFESPRSLEIFKGFF